MLQARPTTGLLRTAAAALFGLLLALTPHLSAPATAQGWDRDPAYAEFYDTLDQHGEWVVHPRYGQTWVPYANEDRGWRPYSRGQWVYTEEHGWLWDSEEEFGWVVYHYGRWLMDDRHGWMWVPGNEWGPAWVAWREGDDVIGWAPLPPEADFDGSGELVFDAYASSRYAPMWMFVAPAMLTMPAIYRHFYPRNRSSFYFGRSRSATFYGFRDRRVFNRGIDRRFIEQRARRPVPVVQVRPVGRPRDIDRARPDGDRRQIGIYRPNLPSIGARPPIGRGDRDRRPPFDARDPRPGSGTPTGLPPRPAFPQPRNVNPGNEPPIGRQPPSVQPGFGTREDGRPRPDFGGRPPASATPRNDFPTGRQPPSRDPSPGRFDERPRPRIDGGSRPPAPPFAGQRERPPAANMPPPSRPQVQAPPPQPKAPSQPPAKRPPQGGSPGDNRPLGSPRQ